MKHSPNLFASLATALTCLSATPHSLAQQVAEAFANAKSLQLLSSNPVSVAGRGDIYTHFSTFNGTYGEFLIDPVSNYVSGEIRPRLNAPGVYEGSYAQASQVQYYDYGSYSVTIPQTDVDSNGVPDFIQVDRATNITATGSGYSMVAKAPFSISFKITRSANDSFGTYSATTMISGSTASTVTGTLIVNNISGTATYTRGAVNSVTFAVNLPASSKTATGTTTYSIGSGGSSLSYNAFSLVASDGVSYEVTAGTLTRSGLTYRGTLTLVDGIPETYWADLRDYWIAIVDSNDIDGDGVSDITDALPAGAAAPAIITQPLSQAVTVGSPVTLTFGVSGVPTPRYQWQKNGVNISGATSASYRIASTAAGNSGGYSVVATNLLGSVTSNTATLTVTAASAPIISTQPLNQVVRGAQDAVFEVRASSNPAPTYRWQRKPTASASWSDLAEGGSYTGTTTATLTVVSPGLAMSGDQVRCIVRNGINPDATSSPATLTVNSAGIKADINADGKSDLLWENTATGQRYAWLMNGTTFASGVDLGTLSAEWHIAGTGDFNGDGKTDIVWENSSTGDRYVWLMNGSTFSSSVYLGNLSAQWRIAGTGDFNADGKTDLVWENTSTGDRYVWLMNGTTFASSAYLGNAPVLWHIAGAGDFNGDGQPDILWENTATGERGLWLMSGTRFSSWASLGTVATQWRIRN